MFETVDSMEVAGLYGLVFYLVNLLGNITFAWVKTLLPHESMLTKEQDAILKGLWDLHNVVDERTGQPRWWNHPDSQEAQQQTLELIQSMQHNMSTLSGYIQDANKRDIKAFDQLFKLVRDGNDQNRDHDSEMTQKVGILLERSG